MQFNTQYNAFTDFSTLQKLHQLTISLLAEYSLAALDYWVIATLFTGGETTVQQYYAIALGQ